MKPTAAATAAILILSLNNCGGGSSTTSAGSGTQYPFVAPALNSARQYSETVVDNFNNTITLSFTDTVIGRNVDGSYVVLSQDPSHTTVVVNGTNYSVVTETQMLNNSGQETSLSYTASNGDVVSCMFDPHGAGPDFPLSEGQTWTLDYTYTCGTQAPITYTQQGSVVDVEAVTVPAGSYSAIKLQSTSTWTDAHGTNRTQTITNWRDVNTLLSVKQLISIAYSGAIPTTGYELSRETVLQSTS